MGEFRKVLWYLSIWFKGWVGHFADFRKVMVVSISKSTDLPRFSCRMSIYCCWLHGHLQTVVHFRTIGPELLDDTVCLWHPHLPLVVHSVLQPQLLNVSHFLTDTISSCVPQSNSRLLPTIFSLVKAPISWIWKNCRF